MKPAADTSIIIPAFSTWHRAHGPALEVVDRGVRLPFHVAFETYSVLTRLPRPHRAAPSRVAAFLEESFPDDWLILPAAVAADAVRQMAESGIAGGATYDALIGMTAKHAGVMLLTRDRRALAIYERLGVDVELVG